ncbi:MAG: sigma-70 family RNA polymerase sigma factor [Nocardioides sp.]
MTDLARGSDLWLTELSDPDRHDDAVVRLHELLLRIARSECSRRADTHGLHGPELDDLAHQAAADALISITARLDDFRGESRFTTWAFKFVVFEVSSKVTRHAWRRSPLQLDDEGWERLPARLGANANSPEALVEAREMVDAAQLAIQSVLTPHQRRVFLAVAVEGVPLDVLVERFDTNRNAIYKTMFDARRKIRAQLVTNGYLAETPITSDHVTSAEMEANTP